MCEATDEAVASIKDAKQGQIVRKVTGDDVRDLRKMFEQERREYEICQREIKQLALDMKLVDVEHLYGGERVVIYYLAEDRIDFRELVKSLATEFQTRIEMRQIGVRDEAKLLADYGDCGKPVCCNTHLSEMPPVSMKMAKLQRATLDPSKISGRCGRLKCCLRYEYDTYQDLQRDLPPVGADIITNKGRARVLAQEILAGQVLVETEDMRRIVIDAADVLTVLKRERKPRETAGAQAHGRRTCRRSIAARVGPIGRHRTAARCCCRRAANSIGFPARERKRRCIAIVAICQCQHSRCAAAEFSQSVPRHRVRTTGFFTYGCLNRKFGRQWKHDRSRSSIG